MKEDALRFTLRIDPTLMRKLAYVAEFDGRTKNREIEQLIKKRINEFEREHGKIAVDDTP